MAISLKDQVTILKESNIDLIEENTRLRGLLNDSENAAMENFEMMDENTNAIIELYALIEGSM